MRVWFAICLVASVIVTTTRSSVAFSSVSSPLSSAEARKRANQQPKVVCTDGEIRVVARRERSGSIDLKLLNIRDKSTMTGSIKRHPDFKDAGVVKLLNRHASSVFKGGVRVDFARKELFLSGTLLSRGQSTVVVKTLNCDRQ
jgi:hypothetical protein